MHTKKQKTLAFAISSIIIIVAFFSMLFIVKEAEHDCTGKDCPVCACIYQAEQTLKQLGTGDTGRAMIVPDFLLIIVTFSPVALITPCISLIGQKVRLNN